ncbi:hypothetical protein II906_00325 [bacterium]|nr:hypothetical protein [bacterium]
MYKFVSLDVLYMYLLIESAIKTKNKESIERVVNFFKLLSVSDIIRYSNAVNILNNTLDLRELRKFVLDNSSEYEILANHLSKINIVILNFLKTLISNITTDEIEKTEKQTNDILTKYSENGFVQYIKNCINFISEENKKNPENIGLLLLYCSIKEYMDLFKEAESTEFNAEYINNVFKPYFDLLHYNPNNIVFYNSMKNIKIMQDLFKFKDYTDILKLLGLKDIKYPMEKYFLIEIDKNLANENRPELLYHELGHLLNLKIYNFQDNIINYLYKINPKINLSILNYWLNELIADTIGYTLYEEKKQYLEAYKKLLEGSDFTKYPPLDFRISFLKNKNFRTSSIKDKSIQDVANLILKNRDFIKKLLNFVKK